ncbi:MAG TPA: DegQ family serine endoprotease [archaeon]|nr:DegQ family serine endoprotease [archaeon]
MNISAFTKKISRLSLILSILLGLSACSETPVIAVKKLAAQSRFGAESPPLAPLETRAPQFKQVFADVAEKVIPMVVSITSTKVVQVPNFDPFDWFFGSPRGNQPPNRGYQERRTEGVGSGVIVSKDGYILTNNHVVEGADDLTVSLSDKREFQAKIVGTDPPSDIAVIKLVDAKDLPVAYLGDSEKLRIGEWVMAIGSPYKLSETVTLGIVSALGRETGVGISQYENFIQTDAAINPGNSGGALVNLDGAVVGINAVIFSQTGGSQGIGFAIPINMAKQVMDLLITEGRVSRGWLGVYIQDIDSDIAKELNVKPGIGVLIPDVQKDTPAEKAGIKPYDIITRVNGEPVKNRTDLQNKVAMIKPGTEAEFTVLREGKEMKFKVVLGERPEQPQLAGRSSQSTKEKTGLVLENLTPQIRQQNDLDENQKGVIIVEVDPTSNAARARLQEGDIILEADRKEVNSVADFNRIVSQVKGDIVLLRIYRTERGGAKFFVPLRLEK